MTLSTTDVLIALYTLSYTCTPRQGTCSGVAPLLWWFITISNVEVAPSANAEEKLKMIRSHKNFWNNFRWSTSKLMHASACEAYLWCWSEIRMDHYGYRSLKPFLLRSRQCSRQVVGQSVEKTVARNHHCWFQILVHHDPHRNLAHSQDVALLDKGSERVLSYVQS
jgi:hypothetical protein